MPRAEVWRDIIGYESIYQVSSLGRVRSLPRLSKTKQGIRRYRGRVLKIGLSNGYPSVNLGQSDNRRVHHLVASAFLGPRPKGHLVLHWDDVRENNAVGNLRYGSKKENYFDSIRNFGDRRWPP